MKITEIAPLAYEKGKMKYFQFIRGGIGDTHHQEPKFYQYPNGEVIMYWNTYGVNECSNNSVKLFSASNDKGLTWSNPQIFSADYLGGVPYFQYMIRLKDSMETLMLYIRTRHNAQIENRTGKVIKHSNYFESSSRAFIRRSNDGGRTFDHGKKIPYELIAGGKELPGVGFYGSINDVIQLESGRIIVAFTFMDPERIGDDHELSSQHYTGVCIFSDDNGNTWRRSNEITSETLRGVMELQLVETKPNKLLAFFRNKSGYIYQTTSEDGGESWTESMSTSLPSPESMPQMKKLQSGNILLVWNNISSTTQHPRHPISAAISKDGGKSWSNPKAIADETGSNQLSNHGMIQLKDGKILLGISHYRDVFPKTSDLDLAIFDEDWVLNMI